MSQIDKNNITMIGADTIKTNINNKDHAYAQCLRRQIKIYKENQQESAWQYSDRVPL